MKSHKFKNCTVIDHPVLQHKLTRLRKKETSSAEFRLTLREIAALMAYELGRDIPLELVKIETPLEPMKSPMVHNSPVLVSIQRAGNGMLDGMLEMLPFSKVGHIGIYRDKFIGNTVEYYFRLPPGSEGKTVLLMDPLLATGDTAVAAVDRLKQYHVGSIKLACVLAAPVGIERMKQFHPDVKIFTLCIERELNKKGYILPGLGDAGDRLFNTV